MVRLHTSIITVFFLTDYLIKWLIVLSIPKCNGLGLASVHPEPNDKEAFIKSQTYDLSYPAALPKTYAWPKL